MSCFNVKIYLTADQEARLEAIAKTRTVLTKKKHSPTGVLEDMLNTCSYGAINDRLTYEEKINEVFAEKGARK